MPEEHLILCGGVSKSAKRGVKIHELQPGKEKHKGEVYLDIKTLTEKMVMDLPPVLHDLLQVATYVYVGDQVVSRGALVRFDYGDKWHRYLHFIIPIREYDVWTEPEIKAILEDALSFGSGDTYTFDFISHEKDRYPQFLNFPSDVAPEYQYDEVLLFSGGIDSFTGAVDEVVSNKKRSVLVSHRSNNKLVSLQGLLFDYLTLTVRENADLLERALQPVHVPIMINKKKEITKETSQRTRSFLYASLGTIVARIFGLNRVKFYENGIVSCNLSFDGQTLQARSTRSTHPKLLYLLSKFVSELTDSDFTFENPYFAKTKTEVCLRLKELHHEPQIKQTRSCAKSNYVGEQKHCGTCSQCIDRRFATLASECQKYDPGCAYVLDIFKDELKNTHDRAMAAGLVGFANQIEGMTDVGFVQKYGAELHEIAPYLNTESREVALKALYNLHKRHAVSVGQVMDKQIADNSTDLRRATLPNTCLISMVASRMHLEAGQILKKSAKDSKNLKKKIKAKQPEKKFKTWNNQGDARLIIGKQRVKFYHNGKIEDLRLKNNTQTHKLLFYMITGSMQPSEIKDNISPDSQVTAAKIVEYANIKLNEKIRKVGFTCLPHYDVEFIKRDNFGHYVCALPMQSKEDFESWQKEQEWK